MLTIRYLRSGRANSAFFRIVLTEKSKPCNSGFIEVLGWYNPHTKKISLNKEEILSWVGKGAIASNSVAKLLIANGIKHKNIKFVPDAPKQKKQKKDQAEKPKVDPAADQATEEAQAEEDKVAESKPEEVKEEEKPAEEVKEQTQEDAKESESEKASKSTEDKEEK